MSILTATVDGVNLLSVGKDERTPNETGFVLEPLTSYNYDKELSKLKEKIPELNASLLTRRISDDEIRQFADLVEKHANITTMTTKISHELIDRILVHKKDDNRRTKGKRLEIFFRFVGKIDIRRRN